MSTTIEDRVILLLRDKANEPKPTDLNAGDKGVINMIKSALAPQESFGGHGFWERLGEYTGISSKRWRKVYGRDQRVTSDMLQALAQLFPENAFWLATGITDATNGHIAPDNAQIFPERLYYGSSSDLYFRRSLELVHKLFQEAKIDLSDDKKRMEATERTRPFGHSWDSSLCDTAYRVASSEEYQDLKETWNAREKEREIYLRNIKEPEKRPLVVERKKRDAQGLKSDPSWGIDPRTKHQDSWDLFYEPVSKVKEKSDDD